jgi:tetratricopeptide (TPR) repeat protein
MSDAVERNLKRLEAAVTRGNGADTAYAGLADAYRRAGRLADAEAVARRGLDRNPDAPGGSLVLALVLLEQGRIEEAKSWLEPLADALVSAPPAAADPDRAVWTDAELDDALDAAQTDTDALIDPDRVAREAVAQVDTGFAVPGADEPLAEALETGGTFATRTMAELLERQGDRHGAARIRAALRDRDRATSGAPDATAAAPSNRQRTLVVLESWLQNLRGGAR